jgi:hypothetical protein
MVGHRATAATGADAEPSRSDRRGLATAQAALRSLRAQGELQRRDTGDGEWASPPRPLDRHPTAAALRDIRLPAKARPTRPTNIIVHVEDSGMGSVSVGDAGKMGTPGTEEMSVKL